MFNHARTLLLNLSGVTGYLPDNPGEELIPVDYRPVVLPTYLEVVRLRLFGATPDRAMLNYRSAQLLRLIAATELQTHVQALDPRITYETTTRQLTQPDTFTPQIHQYAGPTSAQLRLLGEPIKPDVSGKSAYSYQITAASATLQIRRVVFPLQDISYPITLTQGVSLPVALPFSGYKVRVNTTGPAAWTVRGFLRPQLSLAEIEQGLRSIGEPYLIQLFGASSVEPYQTFRNCWEQHPEFAYRLGGLVLAAIYRTEELRNGKK